MVPLASTKLHAVPFLHIRFYCATHNVRSIACPSDADSWQDPELTSSSIAMKALEEQYHEHSLIAIGLQEARRYQQKAVASMYYIIASDACDHNLGVELWFSLVLPFSAKGHCFKPSDFHVIHTCPRFV